MLAVLSCGRIDSIHIDFIEEVEATVKRARPVVLTALAAVLAFIPLTSSVFRGSLAYRLIGGTIGGTALTLVFLSALCAAWLRIRKDSLADSSITTEPEPDSARIAPHAVEHATS